MSTEAEKFAAALEATPTNDPKWKWKALCPAHDDSNPSLSLGEGEGGKLIVHCHAGCGYAPVVAAIEEKTRMTVGKPKGTLKRLKPKLLPAQRSEGAEPADSAEGMTLKMYSDEKLLPMKFLEQTGCRDFYLGTLPCVRIPYHSHEGAEVAVRFRLALDGGDKFRWRKGDKPCLYGLESLEVIRRVGEVVLVEGESDSQTLWFNGIPALGLPGNGNWNEQRDAPHLEGFDTIYVAVEPGASGEGMVEWLATSAIRDRAKLMYFAPECKDVSAMYLQDVSGFKAAMEAAKAAAVSWQVHLDKQRADAEAAAWALCEDIATHEDVLAHVNRVLERTGVVGEEGVRKLLYLAQTSRVFPDKPISVIVKGQSSAGKSFLVEQVAKAFPPEATYAITAMSERALVYGEEPLSKRHIIIYEATGAAGEFQSYIIRSLLSEGRLVYPTVEKNEHGKLVVRTIEREGPTGLITTTTATSIHAENETRMLSLTVNDTPEQTRKIMRRLAMEIVPVVDLSRWHAYQRWIALRPCVVTIPYGGVLSILVKPIAVRLRRDFKVLLNLVRAHCLLHQHNRERTPEGAIIATLADYAAVRDLVADAMAEGVEATVKKIIRDTVEAVDKMTEIGSDSVTETQLAARLKVHKSTVQRRVKVARSLGYLANKETRKGYAAQIVLAAPLPDDVQLLPTVEEIEHAMREVPDDYYPP